MTSNPDKERMAFQKSTPKADDTTRAIPKPNESKKEKQNIIKDNQECDVVKGEPIIELMRVCREFRIADADWITKRIEYQNRKQEFDQNWQNLREKERLLRFSFVKLDEFIKENRDKRNRAERKIKDEKEIQMTRKAEIAKLESTLEDVKTICLRMKNCVEEYKPFQEYLEILLRSSEFNSIAAIFNRYEALIEARKSLEKNQTNNLQILKNTNAQLQKLTEEKSQNLMDLNSRLAHLLSRQGRARNQTLQWEAMVSRIKELAGRKELEDTQVRASIWNLYRQICKRKDIPVEAKRNELEQQLLIIKRTITELGKIVRQTKYRANQEKRLSQRERGGSEVAYSVNRVETKSSFRSSIDTYNLKRN